MFLRAKWLLLAMCLVVIGCSNPTPYVPTDGSSGGDTSTGDTSIGDTTGGTAAGGMSLTGKILTSGAAKAAPRSQAAEGVYTVVAQSDETGEIYRAATDAEGDFELDLPDDEGGNSFMVTILGPDGRAVGPVLFDEAAGEGATGLTLDQAVSLGTVVLPDDPTAEPIEPGDDNDVEGDMVSSEILARLNQDGVPVGLASHGKGDAAQQEGGEAGQTADADQDGLIEVFDADDDGDGIVDDFDGDGDVGGTPADIIVNFFMNLKIGSEQASPYYSGGVAALDAALATDTIITFEVMTEPVATRAITSARLMETPAPSYLPDADKMTDAEGGLAFGQWADSDYAFDEVSDRFQAFVRPNAVMDAGDTFTVEVTFDDGTSEQYSRMINYVFKNIPRLLQYGAAGALTDFDITDAGVNGSPHQPIRFDGTQDLVLVFNPPPDETGAYLTDLDYTFQIFYYAAADGGAINDQIDVAATWASPPAGFEGTTLRVSAENLTLSAENTYTVTLPGELFPDAVQTTSGSEQAVAAYKIDITTECSSGNAAIMLMFAKH